ncbi:polysaccharide lyase [Arvimicrobium flavum]|uniref:polysaccharide lyase n=1 Tax=Arvimicrobium flavum TaxID=3393320 RepID=UPI00237C15AC|nr:polysaccharide lyase [Mesorhizobium shangrilense]
MNMRVLPAAGLAAAICASGQAVADTVEQVLRDGFDGPTFSDTGGLYYRDNFEQSAGSVEFQNRVARNGGGALKLSVKPLCGATSEGCSERAEIWERTELRVPYDQGVWYGFAVKFGDPIPVDDHRYLIAQWKREIDPGAAGDFSPFFALRLRNGKLFATVETNYLDPGGRGSGTGCAGTGTPVWLRPETNQMRALVATDPSWTPGDNDIYTSCTDAIRVVNHGNSLPTPGSGWIDFAVYTKPGPDGSGRIELFANGKPVVTVTGRIGHADPGLGENQYFKFGPYRGAHTNEWTLYYDDFRRSPRCTDVLGPSACPTQ